MTNYHIDICEECSRLVRLDENNKINKYYIINVDVCGVPTLCSGDLEEVGECFKKYCPYKFNGN